MTVSAESLHEQRCKFVFEESWAVDAPDVSHEVARVLKDETWDSRCWEYLSDDHRRWIGSQSSSGSNKQDSQSRLSPAEMIRRLARDGSNELENAKKEKAKKEKAQKDKVKKEKAKKDKVKKEKGEREKELQLQVQREVEEARQRDQTQAHSAIGALVGQIRAKVIENWNKPPGLMWNLEAVISVKVHPTGEVLYVKVVKSSGDIYFDRSAENAVYKASPLPFPDEPRYYEFIKEFNFKFVPDRN